MHEPNIASLTPAPCAAKAATFEYATRPFCSGHIQSFWYSQQSFWLIAKGKISAYPVHTGSLPGY
jgi:hypothetical protein